LQGNDVIVGGPACLLGRGDVLAEVIQSHADPPVVRPADHVQRVVQRFAGDEAQRDATGRRKLGG